MQFAKQDPRLTPLHGDSRYEDLRRRLAFPLETTAHAAAARYSHEE